MKEKNSKDCVKNFNSADKKNISNLAKNRKTTELSKVLAEGEWDSIDLSNAELYITGTKTLIKAINNCTNLTSLNLYGNSLNDKVNKSLDNVLVNLVSLKTLSVLNLQKNNIPDGGAEAISNTIKTNQTLTDVNVAENNITNRGAQSFFYALVENTVLTRLDLSQNPIKGTKGKWIQEGIKGFLTKNGLIKNKQSSKPTSEEELKLGELNPMLEKQKALEERNKELQKADKLNYEIKQKATSLNSGLDNLQNEIKKLQQQLIQKEKLPETSRFDSNNEKNDTGTGGCGNDTSILGDSPSFDSDTISHF